MCWPVRLLMVATVVLTSGGGWGDPWVEQLSKRPASQIDRALPDQAFAVWFDENLTDHLPKSATEHLAFVPCRADRQDCMLLEVEIASRARTLLLRFDRATFDFCIGSIGGPELEQGSPIASLSELPGRLTQAIRPYPLVCPDDTTLHLHEEHAGLIEWCEDAAAVKQGPARAWFSTGRYLMYRGAYRDGERVGPWFECDRFERCVGKSYQ